MGGRNKLRHALLPKMPAWGEDGTPLPEWAYSREVKRLILRHGADCADGVLPLTCTSGPAVKLGFCALANLWIFFCVAPVIAYSRSTCPDGKGFARCDDHVLFGLLGVVVLVAAELQTRAMGYVIASQLATTKRFYLLNFCFNKFPYPVFIIAMTGLMAAGYLQIMTSAETLGKTLRTQTCDSYKEISDLWNTTMKESAFHFIPGFDGADFVHISFVAYLLMLAQPIFALVYSVPTDTNVDYQAGFGEKAHGTQYKFEYKTLYTSSSLTNHGAVLQVLATASRMEAINFQDLQYAKRRMETWEKGRNTGWELRYLNLANVEIVRGISRFIFVGLLQNAVQTHLQITLMALSEQATQQRDYQVLFSVIVSLLSYLGNFPAAYKLAKLFWSARGLLLESLPPSDAREDYHRELQEKIRGAQWMLLRFIFAMLLYAGMIVYALVKLWGFKYCPEHLINVTGCVTPPSNSSNSTGA